MTPVSALLVIHGGALGDFVLSLSIVRSLRRAGAKKIVMLARGSHAALARRGGVDEFWDIDIAPWHLLFVPQAALCDEISTQLDSFDLVIDMLGAAALAGRPKSSTRFITIDPRSRAAHRGHITDQWFGDLEAAGCALDNFERCAQVSVLEAERRRARNQMLSIIGISSDRIVLMHPGSGSSAKCWPVGNFIELAHRLRAAQIASVFSIGHVEMERFSTTDRRRLTDAAPVLSGTSLEELSQLLAASDCYIGNDSGVSHLAAATGTPTIALFGPTDPALWTPLGGNVRSLRGVGDKHWSEVDEVIHAATSLLKDQGALSASGLI